MLVHICCSVDSHYFLHRIKEEYPNEKIVGYFYDPNIHPYSEYVLRLHDVQYSCDKLGIELIEGIYDIDSWLNAIKGFENEPEKGDRCTICFEDRLEQTAKKAIELNHKSFTTTLLISPKKSQEKLEVIGKKLSKKYDLEWLFKDYRSGNGTHIQSQVVKENSLYRQNYCGCIFALSAQREQQNKFIDEMIEPLGQQILPQSINQRLQLYKKRNSLEEQNINYKIIKERFLNYRLLSAKVLIKKEAIPSYILSYSTLQNGKTSGRIEYENENIHYLNRNEVKLLDLKTFNKLSNNTYKTVIDLIYNPIEFEKEIELRNIITKNPFDLSSIVILDEIIDEKYELHIDSKIFDDVKEKILIKPKESE